MPDRFRLLSVSLAGRPRQERRLEVCAPPAVEVLSTVRRPSERRDRLIIPVSQRNEVTQRVCLAWVIESNHFCVRFQRRPRDD